MSGDSLNGGMVGQGNCELPRHIAIIMDGNGRWAEQRNLPRVSGHKAGVKSVRNTVQSCAELKIEALTLFAFSSENWRRPKQEVGMLMDLFLISLEREAEKLHKNNVQLHIIGDRNAFNSKLQAQIHKAETLTTDNTGLVLCIAANYSGRWDITQAAQKLAQRVEQGMLRAEDITAKKVEAAMILHGLPEPDLFIRTSGEQRISNFLLWQLAYTELYFTDILWPDFNRSHLDDALATFAGRQRRFGYTGDQVEQLRNA